MGGIERVGDTFWAVKQYGGIFLAVGVFPFFGCNDFGGGGTSENKNRAVNRRITGTARRDGSQNAVLPVPSAGTVI